MVKTKFHVEIVGLTYWAWEDPKTSEVHRFNKGEHEIETDNPAFVRALYDAHDAKVGVRIREE